MSRICRAPGCAAETSSRYSPYCNTHRGRLRRQGAVDQQTVTKKELASYVRLVRARIEKNPDNPAWERLDDVWTRVVARAKDIVAQRGGVRIRHEYIAAREVADGGQRGVLFRPRRRQGEASLSRSYAKGREGVRRLARGGAGRGWIAPRAARTGRHREAQAGPPGAAGRAGGVEVTWTDLRSETGRLDSKRFAS